MPSSEVVQTAMDRLFRRKPAASLDQLCQALGTRSRTTVFRALSRIGYRTSFSHAGGFYTLASLPEFDPRGLWFYRDIGFSAHGTLRATIVVLVDRSSAGYTHEELQAELTLRVHDTLRSLVEDQLIGRERVDQLYVYVSTHRRVAAAQLAQRRAASTAALALPPALDPACTIDVLLAVIHHPGAAPKAIVARLAAKGRLVSLAQVEDLFRRYELAEKKTARSHSRRSPR